MDFSQSKWCFVFATVYCFLLLGGCAKDGDFHPNLTNQQNALAYLDKQTENTPLLDAKEQKQRFQNYLAHYYSPWTLQNRIFSNKEILEYTQDSIQKILDDPGWNENKHRHSKSWAEKLVQNMDMATFPNRKTPAITTRAIDMRLFPTHEPSFSSLEQQGNTYPFDNIQESYLPANLPVYILQSTKDKAWNLVLTNGAFGWIPANSLALVDKTFIKNWQRNQGYLEINNPKTSIIDTQGVYRFFARMGAIYPIVEISNLNFVIKIAIADSAGHAMVKTAVIPRQVGDKIPLKPTPKMIATIANQFIGIPYGWGDIYGYRDCSSTTMNIMSYFGIWLPRNSSKQAELGGQDIAFTNLSTAQKKALIQAKGIPFFTLIHEPGHIMLYLGEKDNHLYVLHDMWGLRTEHLFSSPGRAVVGKTVITPLDFGSGYINVKKSLMDAAIDMSILTHQVA